MSDPVVVERLDTPRGELVLRRSGEHFEVISNGTFLMDTRTGESERLLVTAALARCPQATDLLIGGLGVGFSVEAATHHRELRQITVVEIEPAIVGWNRGYFADRLADPRIRIVTTDLIELLRSDDRRYDVICLDIDNGPEWTVTDNNRALYDETGTALVAQRLRPDGVASIWSAARSSSYQALLADYFERVEVHEVRVARGEPDVVMVASSPRA